MKRRNLLIGTGLLTGGAIVNLMDPAIADKTPVKAIPTSSPKPMMPKSNPKTLRGQMVTIAEGLRGYQVLPKEGKGPFPTVLVIMEAFGLNDQIKGVCDLYANYGYAAIAPDIYDGAVFGYDKIGDAVAKLKTLKDEAVTKQFGQTLDFIGKQAQMRSDAVGTVGFCMGGRYAFLIAASFTDRIHSAVCFYGGGIASAPDPLGRASLLPLVPQIKAPVMFIYSAEDEYINGAEHARITQAMSDSRKRYILSVVPNTQHGFMNDARSTYNEAAAMESWDMAFGFFKRYVKNRASTPLSPQP
jgi:carboxymethylenebutenolidase